MIDNTTTQQQAGDDPVQALVDMFGIDLLSPEEQEAFLGELSAAAVEAALLRARMSLTEEKRIAFDALLGATAADPENDDKAQALSTFFEKEVPQFDDLFRAEVEQLKAQYEAIKQEVEQEEK